MHTFDDLVRAYRRQLDLPWSPNAPTAARVWMLWHSPSLHARVAGSWPVFEHETREAGRRWSALDLTPIFAAWVGGHEFRHALIESPDELDGVLPDLQDEVAERVELALDAGDPQTVTSLFGAGALFGLVSVAALLDRVAPRIKGRLLVAFPGAYAGGVYRLLDARGGWNYHAVPIPPDPV